MAPTVHFSLAFAGATAQDQRWKLLILFTGDCFYVSNLWFFFLFLFPHVALSARPSGDGKSKTSEESPVLFFFSLLLNLLKKKKAVSDCHRDIFVWWMLTQLYKYQSLSPSKKRKTSPSLCVLRLKYSFPWISLESWLIRSKRVLTWPSIFQQESHRRQKYMERMLKKFSCSLAYCYFDSSLWLNEFGCHLLFILSQ